MILQLIFIDINKNYINKNMNYFIFFFILFYVSDSFLQSFTDLHGLYYLFHFLHNIIISILTFDNVLESFQYEPPNGVLHPYVIPLVYSLHCYHITNYYSYFRKDDWYHHIFSMIFAVPIVLLCFPNRNLLGFSFFFTTGLPGGLNYLNMFLYKNFLLSKKKQQYFNTILNSWIRCPGILFNCALILQYLSNYSTDSISFFIGLIPFSILFWNGVYFQNIVLENFYSKYK